MDSNLDSGRKALAEQRFVDAENFANQILGAEPDSLEALRLLAESYARRNYTLRAIEIYEKVLGINPQEPNAIKALTSLYWHSGEFAKAAKCCERLADLNPTNAAVANSVAMCRMALHQWEAAAKGFKKAIELKPDAAEYHHNLAGVLHKLGKRHAAVAEYERAVELSPNFEASLFNLADLHFRIASSETALDILSRVEGAAEGSQALLPQERAEKAEMLLERVLRLEPKNARARALYASVLKERGKHEQASKELKLALEADPNLALAYWEITRSKKIKESDRQVIAEMERLASSPNLPNEELILLHNGLAKALEDLGEYQKALHHCDVAHELSAEIRGTPFNREAYAARIDAAVSFFTPEFFKAHQLIGMADELPIFVVGMPRSGTTLAAQVLSSHPDVASAGELPFWPELAVRVFDPVAKKFKTGVAKRLDLLYIQALENIGEGKKRVVDKSPGNSINVGILHTLFPKARIIYCHRNGVANCLSMYMAKFAFPPPFVDNREDLVFAYKENEKLLKQWQSVIPSNRFLTLEYEDLANDPEPTIRKLVEFCGLEWNDSCLHPDRNENLVMTASQWQVRQPVYSSSVDKWKRYEPWLGAFKELIAE